MDTHNRIDRMRSSLPGNAEDKKDAPKYAAAEIAHWQNKIQNTIYRQQNKNGGANHGMTAKISKNCADPTRRQPATGKRCVTCSKMCLKSSVCLKNQKTRKVGTASASTSEIYSPPGKSQKPKKSAKKGGIYKNP